MERSSFDGVRGCLRCLELPPAKKKGCKTLLAALVQLDGWHDAAEGDRETLGKPARHRTSLNAGNLRRGHRAIGAEGRGEQGYGNDGAGFTHRL
jgi:hypothetical protein